ncbi:hypothetical protein [Cycloclasticus zancles]|uniref:Uncharacterized protein n=1 Tax=Cycloclasticus zancles 78-ME TaxID=1198232 RepID=S5T4G8_9GAMM|nr:hypothetical protein [Cycloclasticus zancles]AGS38474.1 hypothetical protein CYCME_0132 [Cycloclasticus zancles 78-ME]
MDTELKQSAVLGISLGLILWFAANLEQSTGMLVSLIACVVFGPLTVWRIKHKPNIYALVVCLLAGVFLVLAYGLKLGAIYLAGVAGLYGVFSVQLSMALANSYDNIVFLVGKFRNRK